MAKQARTGNTGGKHGFRRHSARRQGPLAAPRAGGLQVAMVLGGLLALALIVFAPAGLRWPIMGGLAVLALTAEFGWRRRVARKTRPTSTEHS